MITLFEPQNVKKLVLVQCREHKYGLFEKHTSFDRWVCMISIVVCLLACLCLWWCLFPTAPTQLSALDPTEKGVWIKSRTIPARRNGQLQLELLGPTHMWRPWIWWIYRGDLNVLFLPQNTLTLVCKFCFFFCLVSKLLEGPFSPAAVFAVLTA